MQLHATSHSPAVPLQLLMQEQGNCLKLHAGELGLKPMHPPPQSLVGHTSGLCVGAPSCLLSSLPQASLPGLPTYAPLHNSPPLAQWGNGACRVSLLPMHVKALYMTGHMLPCFVSSSRFHADLPVILCSLCQGGPCPPGPPCIPRGLPGLQEDTPYAGRHAAAAAAASSAVTTTAAAAAPAGVVP